MGPSLTLALFRFSSADPIYFWQQTEEDVTVCVRMPEGVTKEEVQFRLSADRIRLGVQGFPSILEGQLHSNVDPDASAWIIKDNKRCAKSAFGNRYLVSVYLMRPNRKPLSSNESTFVQFGTVNYSSYIPN